MASRTSPRARSFPYSAPGNFQTGVWLVAKQDGSKANFVNRANLPPVGQGFQYYWLGSTWNQAQPRINDALAKLGVTMDQANAYSDAQKAFQAASSGHPKSSLPSQGVTGSGSSDPGSAIVAFQDVADAITSTLDFMKFIAWLFHPRNILRAVEFLVGMALIIFGFQAALQARGERIEGFSTSEGVLTRSGLGRVATELGRATRGRERPNRPRSAPHRTRQRALSQRYRREEDLQRRRARNPRPRRGP